MDWRLFPKVKDRLLEKISLLDKFLSKYPDDKLNYISNILTITSEDMGNDNVKMGGVASTHFRCLSVGSSLVSCTRTLFLLPHKSNFTLFHFRRIYQRTNSFKYDRKLLIIFVSQSFKFTSTAPTWSSKLEHHVVEFIFFNPPVIHCNSFAGPTPSIAQRSAPDLAGRLCNFQEAGAKWCRKPRRAGELHCEAHILRWSCSYCGR